MAVYSIEGSSKNCYFGTTVLINKLDIRNQSELDKAEKQITLLRAIQAEQNMILEKPNFQFFKDIHKFLFDDIYEWAGLVRTINISKKGTIFCDASQIEEIGKLKFERLKKQNYLKELEKKQFIDEISDLYNELNILHPFREGNGRTLRLFITLLIRNAGFDIDFSKCDPDIIMLATINAAHGDISMLKSVFNEMMSMPD